MSVNGFELLAIDVDGTLLNPHHQVSPANRAAVRRAVEAGLAVCLCTGRSWTETKDVVRTLDVQMDAIVLGFGSIVANGRNGQTWNTTPIQPQVAGRLVTFFLDQGFPVLGLCDVFKAGVDYLMIPGSGDLTMVDRWLEMSPCRVERLDAWDNRREVVRLGIIGDHAHLAPIVNHLIQAFPPGEIVFNLIHAPNYGLDVLECFNASVNKWTAIKSVCSMMDIDPQRVVAVGDDVNDLEMIEFAGMGIAMGNAIEAVKSRAKWVTAGHADDGVAKVINRLLSGEMPQNSHGDSG
jgi:hypothetical protein